MFENLINIWNQLDVSDQINLVAVLVSLFVGVVSIIIAVVTLRQNSRMIEESSRPYITVYDNHTNFQDVCYYIIVKNFGQTGAKITKFETDHDLALLVPKDFPKPFEHLVGTVLAPNQSFKAALFLSHAQQRFHSIKFDIEYCAYGKKYSEQVILCPDAMADLPVVRASTKDKELKIISYALQDLVEKHM